MTGAGMFSYTKSLAAVALALAAALGAALWFQGRVAALRELNARRAALQSQLAGVQAYPGMIANCEKRLQAERLDIESMTVKFVPHDDESAVFIKTVVNSAAKAGMQMTDAAKQEPKSHQLPARGRGQQARVVTHEITLRGSYAGLVKFMQSLNAWDIGYRLEFLAIEPFAEDASGNAIEAKLGLSVFSLEQVNFTK